MRLLIKIAILLAAALVVTAEVHAQTFTFPPAQTFPTGSVFPNALAIDPFSGDYWLGTNNQLVRMSHTTGQLEAPVVLNGIPANIGVLGITIDPVTGHFFVSNFFGVQEYVPSTASAWDPISAFGVPGGSALDLSRNPSTGNLLASLTGCTFTPPDFPGVLEEITTAGALVRTINFSYPARFGGCNLLQAYAFDPVSGNHFAGAGDFIFRIPDSGGVAAEELEFTQSNLFQEIRGMAFDSAGRLVVADLFGRKVYVIERSTTPRDRIMLLRSQTNALVAGGSLNQGQGNALTKKLDAAFDKVNQGNNKAAINELNAFLNQLRAFVKAGTLTASQAQAMITGVSGVIQQLSG